MKQHNRAASALLAVFPTSESFSSFADNDDTSAAVNSFIDFAADNHLISENSFQHLEAYIAREARSEDACRPPENLQFSELLEKRDVWLNFSLSVRSLIDRINPLLKNHGIKLPNVSNSMLTRLKVQPADTLHKKNVLRSLAFWIGYERCDLSPAWNYESLMKICPRDDATQQYKEGVRIGFALYSRGDMIDNAVMNWLKKSIYEYIEQSSEYVQSDRWSKIRSHDFTTFFIDIPKESDSSDPASYRSCIKNAVSLAHLVTIRWVLSRYYSTKRFFSVAIAAGQFDTLDNYLLAALNIKLPGDAPIRLSDYVRQCLLISDVRVICSTEPIEATLINGEAFRIWWITAFWNSFFFDFIPDILQDKMLQLRPKPEETVFDLLAPAKNFVTDTHKNNATNAVTTFLRYPHNIPVGIEIAKTLYYRKRFQEAEEIIRIVLSIDPNEITARTLHIAIFRELALSAPSVSIADIFFNRVEHEAAFIIESCDGVSDYFYCEYATTYTTKAVMLLKHLRSRKPAEINTQELKRLKAALFDSMQKANFFYEKAMTVSPFAIRASYSLNVLKILRATLENDEEILVNPEKGIDAPFDIVRKISEERLWLLTMGRADLKKECNLDFIKDFLASRFKIYDESVALNPARANACFTHAVALWDFSLYRTVAIAKRSLEMLEKAVLFADKAAKENVYIDSSTKIISQLMPSKEFIAHMEKSMQMIRSIAGKNIMGQEKNVVLEPPADTASNLMTLNF